MIQVLAGGPAREIESQIFNRHWDGLKVQTGTWVCHVKVVDPGGPRWTLDKIERVAKVRQGFLQDARAFDALFMVDSDVVVGPGVLDRLLAVDADVVYGVFWTTANWKVRHPYRPGYLTRQPQVWDIHPYGWSPACFDALQADGINEIPVLGGGACTLIRGRGFESRYWPLLQSLHALPGMWPGEDVTFCLGLECRDIRQVAVTGLEIEHCYAG